MTDLMSPRAAEIADLDRLGPFLIAHGVDLASIASPATLERGTPVYVDATADPVDVQRRIAQAHVRMLFVIEDDTVLGVVDAAELAERADSLPWPVGPLARSRPAWTPEYADRSG